jgi:hypothetical protein
MNTLSSTNSRRLLWAAFLLLLPGVFMPYAAIGAGAGGLSSWIEFATNSSAAVTGLMLYLVVFFSLFVKGDRTWKPYFIALASIFSLKILFSTISQVQEEGLPIFKALITGYVDSVQTFVDDRIVYSFPVASLSMISMISLMYLSIDSWKVIAKNRKDFTDRIFGGNTFSIKVIVGTMLCILLAIIVVVTTFLDWRTGPRFHRFMVWDIFTLALNLILTSVLALFFFSTINVWWSELVKLASALKDFRLSKYITRLITGYTYTYIFMTVVIITTLATPVLTFGWYGQAFGMQPGWQLIFMIPCFGIAAAAIAFSVILVMRLIFETSVALIHIAQNTSK